VRVRAFFPASEVSIFFVIAALNIFAGSFFSYHHLPSLKLEWDFLIAYCKIIISYGFKSIVYLFPLLLNILPSSRFIKIFLFPAAADIVVTTDFFIVTVIHDDNDHFISKRSAVGDHVFFVV